MDSCLKSHFSNDDEPDNAEAFQIIPEDPLPVSDPPKDLSLKSEATMILQGLPERPQVCCYYLHILWSCHCFIRGLKKDAGGDMRRLFYWVAVHMNNEAMWEKWLPNMNVILYIGNRANREVC